MNKIVACRFLYFIEPPTVYSLTTSHWPQPSPIVRGSSVDLLCDVITGDFPISLIWTDPNGQVLSPGDIDGRISFNIYVYGNYTCTATNHVGEARSTVDLSIEAG